MTNEQQEAEIERLRAEVERLREALEAVHGAMLRGRDGQPGDFGWSITKLTQQSQTIDPRRSQRR